MSNDTADCGCEGHADNQVECKYPALKKVARTQDLAVTRLEKQYDDLCDLLMEKLPRAMVAETRDVDELVGAAAAEISSLETRLHSAETGLAQLKDSCLKIVASLQEAYGPEDRQDQHSADIQATHPLRTGDHNRYARALQMVGARHSKYALVDLVNWLLYRIEEKP